MPALPWKSFTTPEGDREYPALLSHLPLASFRAMPKFFKFVFAIQRQLAESEGLIGYSLDAHPLAREFWTLSVWEDRDSLWRFVHKLPHSRAMQDLLPHMGGDWILPFRGYGVFSSSGLAREQATHARARDGDLNPRSRSGIHGGVEGG